MSSSGMRSKDRFRYGYLSICMRVVPRNDTDGWVFREPTVNVFKDVDQLVLAPKPRTAKTLFDGDFHMEFCDNLKQLLQAYFRDFSFERYCKESLSLEDFLRRISIQFHKNLIVYFKQHKLNQELTYCNACRT